MRWLPAGAAARSAALGRFDVFATPLGNDATCAERAAHRFKRFTV